MKIQEIRQMSVSDMWKALRVKRRELAVKKFHVATGQAQDTATIRFLKKTIARIMTLLNEKNTA